MKIRLRRCEAGGIGEDARILKRRINRGNLESIWPVSGNRRLKA
jgi:hypothetical protein